MKTITEELQVVKKRSRLLKEFEGIVEEKGFIKVESDFFEGYDSFVSMNPNINQKKMVKLMSPSGEVLVLKPDITSNIIKQVIPRLEEDEELLLYYSDYMFQYTKDSIKVKRTFGLEIIGDSLMDDIFVIDMVQEMLDLYQLDYVIEIGNQKYMEILFSNLQSSKEDLKDIRQFVKDKNIESLKKCLNQDNYSSMLLKTLEVEDDFAVLKQYVDSLNIDPRLKSEIERLEELKKGLKSSNLHFDLSLLNEYDYYNGPIYKGYLNGYNKELFSGGRYDTLSKQLTMPCNALGVSINMDAVLKEVL
jgi:ATP phosphoribosyltransferase regulatory subunit